MHFADDEAEEEQRNKMGGTSSKGNESLSKDLPGDEGEDEPLSFSCPTGFLHIVLWQPLALG